MSELTKDRNSAEFQKAAKKSLTYRWICYGILVLTYIFVYFDRVAPAVVAPDLMNTFGINATALGLLSALYFWPYAAMQIPSGVLSDRLGPRYSVAIFFCIAAVGTALFGIAQTYNMALLGRALMGIGVAVVYLPIVRIAGNWFRPTEYAFLIGLMLTWGNLGAIFASSPLALLVGKIGWRNSFFILGVGMVVLAVLNLIILRNKPQDMGLPTVSEIDGIDYYKEEAKERIPFSKAISMCLKDKNYWKIAIYVFCVYGTIMGFQGLWAVPYFIDVFGMTKQTASNILMMFPIGFAIGAPIIGYLSDKVVRSRRKVALYGVMLYAIAWIPVTFMTSTIPVGVLYPLVFVMGLLCGAYLTNYAHLTDSLPNQILATASGLVNIWCFAGGAAFQQIMGRILDVYGKVNGHFPIAAYKATFLFCFLALIISAIVMYFTTETYAFAKKEKASATL